MNSIFIRRSVRNFLTNDVEDVKLDKILRAAMQAPSAGNGQPWEFIVVKGQKNLNTLAQFSPYATSLKKANLGIVVLGNKTKTPFPEYWQQDLGAATQNILLEATELGLGSVWYGVAPERDRMVYISKLYKLDEHLLPFCVIAIGYPEKENANHFVDRFDFNRVRYVGNFN